MADILIRGFEMPTDASLWLMIKPDGTVHKIKAGGKHGEPQQGVAVPLPEGHGRLIDADELIKAKSVNNIAIMIDIADAPTIVPAEGGGAQ